MMKKKMYYGVIISNPQFSGNGILTHFSALVLAPNKKIARKNLIYEALTKHLLPSRYVTSITKLAKLEG